MTVPISVGHKLLTGVGTGLVWVCAAGHPHPGVGQNGNSFKVVVYTYETCE